MDARDGGIWKVALILFVPVVLILIAQLLVEENRYLGPDEARAIAAEEKGLDSAPEEWELTFDESPPESTGASAVWEVESPASSDPDILVDMLIDAESGEVLTDLDPGD